MKLSLYVTMPHYDWSEDDLTSQQLVVISSILGFKLHALSYFTLIMIIRCYGFKIQSRCLALPWMAFDFLGPISKVLLHIPLNRHHSSL